MRKSILVCMLVVIPGTGGAVKHPVLVDPQIISCLPNAEGVACSDHVLYRSAGTTLDWDVPVAMEPNPRLGTDLKSYGVWCWKGDRVNGVPYSSCSWTQAIMVAPPANNCKLRNTSSWELAYASSCATNQVWGPNYNAGPGGECIVFAQEQGDGMKVITSIHGVLNADAVANGSNTFCQKMYPPDVVCTVVLPQEIEHGNVQPTALSRASIFGEVSCGSKPVVGILGEGRLELGPGVSTVLSIDVSGGTTLRITSDLTVINAEPGDYGATFLVLVSPY